MKWGAFDMGQRDPHPQVTHDVRIRPGLFSTGTVITLPVSRHCHARTSPRRCPWRYNERVLTQMLGDFKDEVPLLVVDCGVGDLQGVVNGGESCSRTPRLLRLPSPEGSSDVHIRSLLPLSASPVRLISNSSRVC